MAYQNINNRQSITSAYTESDHNQYMSKGNGDRFAAVEIITAADDDGDFRMSHGYTCGKNGLNLPVQDSYETMIDWIIVAAKTGRA